MKVYVVLDHGKACYDAGSIYCGVYLTRAAAEESISGYEVGDRKAFEIIEEDV